MSPSNKQSRPNAFTLIELMVAVAIIALLVGILVPTLSSVTGRAKEVATQARLSALDQGLQSYSAERSLGGLYPPSHGDNAFNPMAIANPFFPNSSNIPFVVSATGANFLVYALTGADRLGTPGFKDMNQTGTWYEDQSAGPGNAYELDPNTLDPVQPRFPRAGGSYVDEASGAGIRTYQELFDEGIAVTDPGDFDPGFTEQPFFTDAWSRPILYYRANRAGRAVVTDPGNIIGVYDHRDNAVLTGTNLQFNPASNGADFGPGIVSRNTDFSRIGNTQTPGIDPNQDDIRNNVTFDDTFERFIQDPSVTAQNRPVNPEKFLLISAGLDAVYGTNDDVVNWERR